jgi:hypothetical protein
MTYTLYRTERLGAGPAGAPLTTFSDFESALAARDDDLLAQLERQPAPRREITHVIVGPGATGPQTEHPIVTYAGVDADDTDPAGDLAATRTWLDALRGR